MKSFFGRIYFTEQSINQDLFHKSLDALNPLVPIQQEVLIKDSWALGFIRFKLFDQYKFQDQDLKILSDSAIYNREELRKKLDINNDSLSDDTILLEAYKKWGKDCVQHLIGDFAFAIWDVKKEELFCARDHLGVKPFNYYFQDDQIVFSSDSSAILSQKDMNFSIDERFIADSISIIKSEQSRSTYHEIKKLPPAHYLFIKSGEIEVKQYWQLSAQKEIQKSHQEIIEEFKSKLFEAVKSRVEDLSFVGCELSGGLDSSSVTAIANQFSKVKTFSHTMPDHLLGKIHPFQDERDFIHTVTDFCKITNKHFVTSEKISLLDTLKQNVKDHKVLMQQNFGVFSDHLYMAAMNEDVSVLLSGFGGDEVVTSKSSGYLKELAAGGRWKELKEDLKNQKKKYQFYKFYLKEKFPFLVKAYHLFRKEKLWWEHKTENLAINKTFYEQLKIEENYFQYHQKEGTNLQERNIERITHPHVAQRLEYSGLIARKYGVEYRYPLFDIRLIEYYLAVPARLKARDGIDRYIVRKAMDGVLPEKIQWRNDKTGATIPTVFMRTLNDKQKILNLIEKAKTNESVKQYIDLEKYEVWFQKLCLRSEKPQRFINPAAFYNYLKLIIFIENNPKLFK